MIPDLSGKKIAIVAMGKSHNQFVLAKTHSQPIDEVWAINAMAGVIYHDRVFMMDPASRFLDSDDAGTQTGIMRSVLKSHPGPIYTCELDDRCPGLVDFPLDEVMNACGTGYFNNTVAYAIGYGIASIDDVPTPTYVYYLMERVEPGFYLALDDTNHVKHYHTCESLKTVDCDLIWSTDQGFGSRIYYIK